MSKPKKEKKMESFGESTVLLPFRILGAILGICEAYVDIVRSEGILTAAPVILEHAVFEAPREFWEAMRGQ